MPNMENSPESKQLSEKEAREEAALLRAKLGINPHTGKVPTSEGERAMIDISEDSNGGGRETTAEDYDAALAGLEELRKLATQVPATEKIFNIFGRLSVESAVLLVYALGGIKDVIIHDLKGGKFENPSSDAALKVLSHKERFEDAAYQLSKLRKEAKRYDPKK